MSKSVNESHRSAPGQAADVELMAGVRATCNESLRQLVRRYTRLVHRVAADILHDATEAEDVTQEVFFEIYRKAHLYDPARGSVRVWLLQYAYHRSLRRKDALRRRAAWRGEPLETIEARPVRPARDLSRDECRWVIDAGLAELTPRQRVTLELTCFHGLTLADVATHLCVSTGSARHYYYRGLARLRSWARRTAAEPATAHAEPSCRERPPRRTVAARPSQPRRRPKRRQPR